MSSHQNLREWTRIQEALNVSFEVDHGATLRGTTRNISANGVLIEGQEVAEVGVSGTVTISRCDEDSELAIQGLGEVVRSDGAGLAVRLTALIGEESYTHLRNLIVYNAAGDADKADQEFRDHIGLIRPSDQSDS